jgi:hypothetical protein
MFASPESTFVDAPQDMAQQFVGMTVTLTLANNAQLKGTVNKVDFATQILHLRDGSCPSFVLQGRVLMRAVYFLASGSVVPNYSIDASHIISLDIVNGESAVSPSAQAPPATQFQDPAIVSVRHLKCSCSQM